MNAILFANGFCRCNQGNIRPLEWALIQYDCYPHRKGKSRRRDRHTNKDKMTRRHRGRTPRDDDGRHRSGATVSQGMLTFARNPPEARKRKGKFSLQVSEEVWSCPHLDLGHQNCETINFYHFQRPCVVALCCGSPRKLKQYLSGPMNRLDERGLKMRQGQFGR